MWHLSFLGLLPVSHQNLDGGKGEAVCISYMETTVAIEPLCTLEYKVVLNSGGGLGREGGGGGGCMGSKLGKRMCTLI